MGIAKGLQFGTSGTTAKAEANKKTVTRSSPLSCLAPTPSKPSTSPLQRKQYGNYAKMLWRRTSRTHRQGRTIARPGIIEKPGRAKKQKGQKKNKPKRKKDSRNPCWRRGRNYFGTSTGSCACGGLQAPTTSLLALTMRDVRGIQSKSLCVDSFQKWLERHGAT